MLSDPATEKIQIGSLVEVKIGDRPYTYLMVDEDEPETDQVLSTTSALGRQLLGRHLTERFHCRWLDGKVVPAAIEHIAKIF